MRSGNSQNKKYWDTQYTMQKSRLDQSKSKNSKGGYENNVESVNTRSNYRLAAMFLGDNWKALSIAVVIGGIIIYSIFFA